jgi:hypothetical protein
MELIKQHIKTHLPDFTVYQQSVSFDELFLKLCSANKLEYKALLQYIFGIIETNSHPPLNTNFLNPLHIHLDIENKLEIKSLILEFLWHYYFNKAYALDNKEEVNYQLEIKIKKLTNLVNRPLELPYNVTKPQEKILRKERCLIREYLKAYKTLDIMSTLTPKSLINVKVKQDKYLSELLEKSPFLMRIQELSDVNSYVVINFESFTSISKLKLNNIPIFKIFENIILFDCEDRVQRFSQLNYQNLVNLNQRHGASFNNFIVITFDNEWYSINSVRNKNELIKDRFKIPDTSSYTILKSEVDILLERKESSQLSIEFVGYDSSNFWDTFVLETNIRELYELRSIKLMNIYAICYTDEIKNYFIDELFSVKESSELISSTTKLAMLELRDEDIEVLKEALSNTLDVLMNSGIKSKVSDLITNNPTIILDEAILRNQNLLSKVRNCLGLTNTSKFKTWAHLTNSDLKNLVILSYRDQGRYPNYYFPSLLELDIDSECIAKAILPNFLFKQYYNWSKYNLYKEYHKLLMHPIREQHFEWNTLKNKIKELKPKQKLQIDWIMENEYSNSDQRESYKIKLKGQKERTAYGYDLFIISENAKTVYKVVKIDYLLSIDNEDNKVLVQNLDEIQQNINIYDKIVDKNQQEAELEVIRKQFNLGDETAGRLWKVLLKNHAEVKGEDELYSELKMYFETKGIKIVSQFHFKNSWINPQSISIAPLSKRVFIELCEYLKIPKIYFIIIQRIRNASKQSSRQSTRQMNQLLKDLFNDCCFDTDRNPNEIINNRLDYYKANHPLDELGIDENHLAANLVALVELIKPELKPFELETIEKTSNE